MGRAAISLEGLSISSYVVSKAHEVLQEQPGGIHDEEAHSLSFAVVAGLSDLGLRRGSCPAPPQEGPFHRTGTDDGCLLSIWPSGPATELGSIWSPTPAFMHLSRRAENRLLDLPIPIGCARRPGSRQRPVSEVGSGLRVRGVQHSAHCRRDDGAREPQRQRWRAPLDFLHDLLALVGRQHAPHDSTNAAEAMKLHCQ